MKKILTVVFMMLLTVSIVQAAAFEKEAKSRSFKIHISSDKPLGVGSNLVVFDIKHKGKIPKDVQVSVKAFMPAMPGMPAMQTISKAKDLGDGKYETKLNLSMRGTWQLHIFITPSEGKKSRVKSSLSF